MSRSARESAASRPKRTPAAPGADDEPATAAAHADPGVEPQSAAAEPASGRRSAAPEATLKLIGELTIAKAAALHQTLRQLLCSSAEVCLDCSEVTYLDAAILQLMCAAAKSAAARESHVNLRHIPKSVTENARMLGLSSVFSINATGPRLQDDNV